MNENEIMNAELAKPIEDTLADYDTGRWSYDAIDCCLTGKDADLEPWGQQGLQLVAVSEDKIKVRLHLGKTFCGTDVCLNKGIDWDDHDEHSKAIDEYLEQAGEVICGIPFSGEWSGDDWYICHQEDVEIDYILDSDGDADVVAIWESLRKALEPVIEQWEEEIVSADEILNVLAGWKEWDEEKEEYVRLPEII